MRPPLQHRFLEATAGDLGSFNRNALSRDTSIYLHEELTGGVIKIQGERTAVRVAAATESERFTEVDGSHEVPIRVIAPHAMSELVGPVCSVLPYAETDVPCSRINIRVVNLCPSDIPKLVRLLDGLPPAVNWMCQRPTIDGLPAVSPEG